jgi:hypothetical protein
MSPGRLDRLPRWTAELRRGENRSVLSKSVVGPAMSESPIGLGPRRLLLGLSFAASLLLTAQSPLLPLPPLGSVHAPAFPAAGNPQAIAKRLAASTTGGPFMPCPSSLAPDLQSGDDEIFAPCSQPAIPGKD